MTGEEFVAHAQKNAVLAKPICFWCRKPYHGKNHVGHQVCAKKARSDWKAREAYWREAGR
jgi:hypothetical protein